MRRRGLIGAAIAAIVAGTGVVSMAATHRPAPAGGSIDPSNFVRHVTNPFFPLKPGTVFVYKGKRDGQTQTDRVTVTHRTRMIQGVRTTAVRDVATHHSRLLEKTTDWYAQDKQGNAWYFGEATKSFEGGKVSTEGSWLAGRNGAVPGIIMEANPHVADGYRQEFYKGHAEDQAWVLTHGGSIRVPYGLIHPTVLTMEWTPLEPKVVDKKWYGRGLGIVKEQSVAGGHETALLVRVHRP
jgi:hypothetical protein